MRFIRTIVLALACSVLGVVAGRFVARMREDATARLSLEPVPVPALRELVPGLVAAMRVRDRPWSYLRVPAWLAAFVVNFAMAAFSRELSPLLRAAGVDARRDSQPAPGEWPPQPSQVWTAEVPPEETPSQPQVAPGFRPFAP